ncbi:MAG: hypothetical protein ACRDNT_28515 [Streptosporangiaceae bacterium]
MTADEVYGQDPQLRAGLARRSLGYVLGVARTHPVTTGIGPRHEIRRLFTGLLQQLPASATQLHWSRWRRRHQATARACHYRRRTLAPT